VWTSVVRDVGWDERFTFGSSDHAFTWLAQIRGYRLEFAADAVMHQRFRTSMLGMARQHYRYGKSGPHLYKAFRDLGIPPPDNREALRRWRRLVASLPTACRSREVRGDSVRLASFRLGRLVGSIRARVLCL
jgi:hypothetical protein